MSEEQTQTETPSAPKAAEVDPAVISKIAQEAIRGEVEKVQREAATNTQKALEEQSNKIIRALGAEPVTNKSDELAARLLTDTAGVLGDVATLAKQQALQEFEKIQATKEAAEKTAKEQSVAEGRAINALFKERPDIESSAEAKEILEGHYLRTDASLPPAERLKIATEKYDAFLEKIDGKTSAERVKAVASIGGVGNRAAEPPAKKSQAEITREEIAARKERETKLRGRENVSRYRFS